MDERVFQKLGFDKIRERLQAKTLSAPGAELAITLQPSGEPAAVANLLKETAEAEHIAMASVAYPMMGFDDIKEELGRLRAGAALSCAELLRVCRLHKAAKRAYKGIQPEVGQVERLSEMAKDLWYDDILISRIEQAILSEEEVADNASPTLRDIRRKIKSENAAIREKLNSILRSKEKAAYLQEGIVTMREGRFVIPVKQEYRAQIPGLVHGQSSSGATLFIEPMGIVEANNHLRILEEEEKREIARILQELSDIAGAGVTELRQDIEILAYLDLVFAKASIGIEMRAFRPVMNTEQRIQILAGRHPLIDADKVIPVTVDVRKEVNTLIITGPNTGGKTVTLKLIGLFALMAQSGLFVPATEGSTLPVFSDVFADIGDEQSIEQSLSTFSSHMKNIIYILRHADAGSLVLLDEMGAGTDPEEGTALALAVLSELTDRGAHVFATTHYSEIKAYAMTADRFENASMEFDPNSLQPTFRLIMGVAGASNAFLISKRLGLKNDIIDRAKAFMREERLEFDSLMLHAERTRRDADQRMQRALELEKQAKEAEKKIKAVEKDLEERREKAIAKARQEAYEIVRQAKDEMEQVLKEARKTRRQTESEATKTTEKVRAEVNKKQERLKRQIEPPKRAVSPAAKIDPKKLRVGEEVHIISLGADAVVQSLPDNKGLVSVQAGIMTLNIHYSDLQAKQNTTRKVMRTSSVSLERKMVSLSINLHGYNVEEALIEVDKYLDDAFLAGLKEVSIIHGKGTGVLRSGIQQYLRKHPHVSSFRAGKYGEGEGGVTVVTLK